MTQPDQPENPALEVSISDLFDRDSEQVSDAEIDLIVEFYRDLKAKWALTEEEKAKKKDTKARKVAIKSGKLLEEAEGKIF